MNSQSAPGIPWASLTTTSACKRAHRSVPSEAVTDSADRRSSKIGNSKVAWQNVSIGNALVSLCLKLLSSGTLRKKLNRCAKNPDPKRHLQAPGWQGTGFSAAARPQHLTKVMAFCRLKSASEFIQPLWKTFIRSFGILKTCFNQFRRSSHVFFVAYPYMFDVYLQILLWLCRFKKMPKRDYGNSCL